MSDRGILIFAYDGSFEGFLSAVFDSFSMETVPADIVIFDDMEPSLLKIHYVETNPEHAKRVLNGIEQKLGYSVLNMVKKSFLFDGEGKEIAILRFIRKAFAEEIPDTTKIIIAQRISSVMEADKIIILDAGEIVAMGNHEELMATSEIYRETYESQMEGGLSDE